MNQTKAFEISKRIEEHCKRGILWSYTGLATLSIFNSVFILEEYAIGNWAQITPVFALAALLLNTFVVLSLLMKRWQTMGRWQTMALVVIFNLSPIYNFVILNMLLGIVMNKQ